MTIAELIARLEAAPGPDRELDRAVWEACGGTVRVVREAGGHEHERWTDAEGVRWALSLTEFTGSLDCARTLVPEGHWWTVQADSAERGLAKASAAVAPTDEDPDDLTWADTPALALCAAALKAIEAQP